MVKLIRLFLGVCLSMGPVHAATKIVLVGDSTVSNYGPDRPNRGWGQILAGYAKEDVEVKNLAASGTSTKSYRESGRWKEALALHPAYVLIQFGHNDRSSDPARGTLPDAEFRENLRLFIVEAREAGAEPILVTPPAPRAFDVKTGQLGDGRLGPYVRVIKTVGEEQKVVVLDLNERSRAWYAPLGRNGTDAFAPKPGDVNHYNEAGATILAGFIMDELEVKEPKVAALLQRAEPPTP